MGKMTARRIFPPGSEHANKRQRVVPAEPDDASDQDETYKITPSMKDDMREELASLLPLPRVDSAPDALEDDVESEVYGSDDDDERGEPGKVKEKGSEGSFQVTMMRAGEEKEAGEEELKEEVAKGGAAGVKRNRTAAEIMQSMVVRTGVLWGEAKKEENTAEGMDEDYVPEEKGSAVAITGSTAAKQSGNKGDGNGNGKVKKKKRAYYDPRMWEEGRQEVGFVRMAHRLVKQAGKIKCFETGVTLDSVDGNGIGSLWEVLRCQQKFYGREGGVERDSREFLKACMRLGRMIEPGRLARLLGGEGRGEEYCRFVLAGFLGLLNVRKTRLLLNGGQEMVVEDRQGDVIVNADELYPSDDEIVKSMDRQEEMRKTHAEEVVQNPEETRVTKVEDGAPGENENDEIWGGKHFAFEILELSKEDEESFASSMSYVLRTYLSQIVGRPISQFEQFIDKGGKLGMTFGHATVPVCGKSTRREIPTKKIEINRLKWLTESMPAPEIGPGKSFRLGTAELWRHASKHFSEQQLVRMSLIEHDRLLDWLTYVALESKVPVNDQEYNRQRNVVVSIAPIPLLYLADYAAELAMKVLAVAAHVVENCPLEEEELQDLPRDITADEIRYAAGRVLGLEEETRVAYDMFADSGYATMVLTQGSWPHLLARPLSTSEPILLCDRAPASGFGVPVNAVHEAKAVLDSLKVPIRRFLYSAASMFEMKDPSHAMQKSDREEIQNERDAWRKRNGCGRYSKALALSRLQNNNKKSKPEKQDENAKIEVIDLDADEKMAEAEVPKGSEKNGDAEVVEGTKGMEDVEDSKGDCGDGKRQGDDVDVVGKAETVGSGSDLMKDERTHAEMISQLLGVRVDIDDEFLSHNNAAELIIEQLGGRDMVLKRKEGLNVGPSKDFCERMQGAAKQGLQSLLQASKDVKTGQSSSISYHRMAWICMRALGEEVILGQGDGDHILGYGGTANYTNFGVFGSEEKVKLTPNGLDGLIQLVDQHVRREAEMLMACAVHDDGRPWIDRADVVLVTSLRKQKYKYGDIGTL